jgi:hypothetical protein
LLADGKQVNAVTLLQVEALEVFRQVTYMERFKCSYWEYMDTPVEFVNDAITIIGLINMKQQAKANAKQPQKR